MKAPRLIGLRLVEPGLQRFTYKRLLSALEGKDAQAREHFNIFAGQAEDKN